jgi:putative N-acetylmannosamine-6-phosphate epimerase
VEYSIVLFKFGYPEEVAQAISLEVAKVIADAVVVASAITRPRLGAQIEVWYKGRTQYQTRIPGERERAVAM